MGLRRRHRRERSRGPSLVRPMARALFFLLAAGFVLTALGHDPVDLAAAAGRWLLDEARPVRIGGPDSY